MEDMKLYIHTSGVRGYFHKRYRATGDSYYTIMIKTLDGRLFYAPEKEWTTI